MAERRRERIAAIVVTYNRKVLLLRCLEALLGQSRRLDAIYIIDNNSTDGTCEALWDRGLIAPNAARTEEADERVTMVEPPAPPDGAVEIHYVKMPENTGGAGGFHEGMKRSAGAGFDWLWLMDDDLLPSCDALEALVVRRDTLTKASTQPFLLNCTVLSQDHSDGDTLAFPLQEITRKGHPRLGVYYWRLSEVADKVRNGVYRWACPFNGTLVPARALGEIGLPNKEFFIRGDEKDFLWRAAGRLELYTVIDSRAHHPRPRVDAFDWKQYYHIRNMLVVNSHFNFRWLRNLKLIVLSLALGLRHGRRGTALVVRAIADGLTGRLGKREQVHTWLDIS